MRNFLEHVSRSIRERRLLRDGQRVLVAVSGGVDSMVLLHALHRLAKNHHWQLTVAHLNHQLRGRSSDADEKFVGRAAEALQLPFVVERADVRKFARAHGLSVEMAARAVRHDFLARTAARLRITTVALAHHADDQIELFFLRLLRGAGSEGLAGMKWRSPSPVNVANSSLRRSAGRQEVEPRTQLVRPLLDVSKAELKTFARENRIHFREDASNRRRDIQRNRIRHELLPWLRKKFQPALDKTVSRLIEIVGTEAELVTEMARRWQNARSRTPFESLPVPVQRRCLQLQLLARDLVPDFDLIEKLRAKANRAVTLSENLAVVRDASGVVQLREVSPARFDSDRLEVDLGSRAGEVVFGGARVGWNFAALKTFRPPRCVAGREAFDARKVGRRIILRHWQPGDRFQPIGMASPVKLQDLFTNRKIPRAKRCRFVVATTRGGGIFWVEGLRIGERFKLDKRTRRGLNWAWQR